MGAHACNHCGYTSTRKYNLQVHIRNKHGNNAAASTTMNVAEGRHPNVQPGSGIQRNEPTLHCESGPAEIYQPNTVSMEDYTKATESAHGWKNAYENLNNQTGSGVFSREDIDKEIMHFVTPWQIAYQNEKEKNNQLEEYLPIHMNQKMINKINMLRSVGRNHDMGLYPDELIHCICEALHNIVHRSNDIAQRLEHTRLACLLLPIK